MQNLIVVLGVFLLTALLLFVAPLVGLCVGAFVGYVAGLVFPNTLGLIASVISGGLAIPAWQLGAALGFVGGFFKPRVIQQKQD